MRILIGQSVHRKVKRTLYGQGAGRYTDAEIDAFRTEIWSSLNDMLSGVRAYAQSSTVNQEGNSEVAMGREPFWCLGGEEPTEADVTLFSFVASGLVAARYVTPYLIVGSRPSRKSVRHHEQILEADPYLCHSTPGTRLLLLSFPALMDYAGRIHDRFFPDYEKWPYAERLSGAKL